MDIQQEREQIAQFNREVLPKIIKALTLEDGKTWSIEPPTAIDIEDNRAEWRNPSIVSADGERLHIRVGGYQNENRLSISGTYGSLPDGSSWYVSAYMRGEHKDPHITVALTKTPAQIASDIRRRVLNAGYRFYRAEYLKRCQEQDANINATLNTAKRLETASGGMLYIRPSYHGMNDPKKGSLVMDSRTRGVGVKVYGTSVEINWHGRIEMAEWIVKLLAELGEPDKDQE